MSVDLFGRQLRRIKNVSGGGGRGPPGEGFKLTLDGQYDMDNRRLCNLADPMNNNDAISLRVMQSTVQEEVRLVHAVVSSLRNDINDVSMMINSLESQFKENLTRQRIDIETVQDLEARSASLITNLDERLQARDDENSRKIQSLESSVEEAIARLEIDMKILQDLTFNNSQIISRVDGRLSALEHKHNIS